MKNWVERGKNLASSPKVVRLLSNDRVMRLATGVMEARQRVGDAAGIAKEAWSVLIKGHAMPHNTHPETNALAGVAIIKDVSNRETEIFLSSFRGGRACINLSPTVKPEVGSI